MTKVITLAAVLAALVCGGATHAPAQKTGRRQAPKRTARRTQSKPPAAAPATPAASTALEQPPVASAPVEDLTTDPKSPVIDIANEPAKGVRDAAIVLIEFSDFECSYCGRYFADAYPRIDAEYVKTGKIKYVFRNLPLEQMHPRAFAAAQAAACADEQGKFWQMHDRLFENQTRLAPEDLTQHASAVRLDAARFGACLAASRSGESVRADMDLAARLGITGTPSFLIGMAQPGTTGVKVFAALSGALPFDDFRAALDEALRRARPQATSSAN